MHSGKIIKNKKIKYLLFFILCPILMVVGLELAMIVLEPWLFCGFYQYDKDIGFRVRPYYQEKTNCFGFNDRDYEFEKGTDVFRILILGDSFNWAGGREGNYTALLEKRFEEEYKKHKVDVINAGYPMTHTAEQLIILKKFGLQYNPDLVILGFFAGNDFQEADPYRRRIMLNNLYIDLDTREGQEKQILSRPIIMKSRLITFLQQKHKIVKHTSNTDPDEKQKEKGTFSRDKFLEIERQRMNICHLHTFEKGRYRENIDYILNAVSEMNDTLKQKGIKFIIAMYPDEFQVNEELRTELIDTFFLDKDAYKIDMPQSVLKEHIEPLNIPFIDMLDEFRLKQEKEELYKPSDTHWNDKGNQLAADILFDYLKEMVEN